MNKQTSEGPEETSERAGEEPDRHQPEFVREMQKDLEDPGTGMQHLWDTQWQQFLQTLQAPHSTWGSPHLSEVAPWDDAKAFLASFEQVAAACQWPRGEWVARLLPALSGEAQQAFSLLAARDKENYGKVKAAILRGEALRRERQRQHFRQFCCQELGDPLADPKRMYSQVQELCCQWLKPENHTKEEILELLVLEQFLASLPGDVQCWVRAGGPDSCAQAVALLEAFLLSRRETEAGMWQEPLQEWALGPLAVKEEPLELVQGEIPREHAEIFRDTKQKAEEEVALPGLGVTCPTTLLPPENQDMAEDELSKALGVQVEQVMNPKKAGVLFPVLEKTPLQSSQETTFWNVLHEDGENVDSLVKKEETFLPDPVKSQRLPGHDSGGLAPAPVKKEETFLPDAVESQRLPGQDSGKELQESRNRFSQRSNLLRHQRIHTGEKPHQCPECGKKFSWRSHLLNHQKKHTGEKPHECSECGKSFSQKSTLLRHQMIHTGIKPHQCPECGKNFSWRSTLLRHQMIHTGKKPHQCPECGKRFSRRSNLLRHRKVHTGEKPHECPECGKRFSQKSDLLTHQMIHTGKKPHQCPECRKNFSRRSQLLSHLHTHTGEVPHKCANCGKGFSHRSALLRHQKIHTGEKPHKCPECGKSFTQRSHLLSHQNVHTGGKLPKCPDFGKSFSDRSSLSTHQKINAGEKPHKCPECGKSFFRRAILLIHQNIHTGEKPHKCPDCGKGFSQRPHLLTHQKTHTERNHTASLGMEKY